MVLATKTEDAVVVGISCADSCVDMTMRDLALRENLAFWKVKGEKDCYIFVDDLKYSAEVLRLHDYIFKGIEDGESIIKNVLPKMKEILAAYDQITGEEWQNSLLIVKGNRMYRISSYFCVREELNDVAFCNTSYLMGAMDSLDITGENKLVESIRLLNKIRGTNMFPLTVFNSKTKKIKVHEK